MVGNASYSHSWTLPAGRQFNRVLFGGTELADTNELTQEVSVNKKEGKLKHTSANTLVAEMVVEITVTLLDGREVSLIFDQFPEESIRVRDVTEVIADGIGVELEQLYIVRTYPTLRPVMFDHEHLLLGFHGVRSKGIWAERPYPGPIRPASIPTPPAMKFKVGPRSIYSKSLCKRTINKPYFHPGIHVAVPGAHCTSGCCGGRWSKRKCSSF